MSTALRTSWPRIVAQAVAAGVAGGLLVGAYVWLTTLVPTHRSVAGVLQWIASTAFGKSALGNPAFDVAGLAIHAVVSVAWAGGYAYVAAVTPAADRRWAISGIVYGLIVYTIMQTILLADNNFTYPPNPNAFVNALIAHAVFFGLPVAYVVMQMRRRRA
jgi:hypothetical protein